MRFKKLRIDNDIKQAEIAKLLGITQQQYSLYENEIREFKIQHLIKLSNYYKCSIDYMLNLTDKKERY